MQILLTSGEKGAVAHLVAHGVGNGGAFGIGRAAIGMRGGRGRKRLKAAVFVVRAAQNVCMQVSDIAFISGGTVNVLGKYGLAVSGPAFVEPDLFRGLAGHEVSNPGVGDFMRPDISCGTGGAMGERRLSAGTAGTIPDSARTKPPGQQGTYNLPARYLITGCSGGGKSTLCDHIGALGHHIVPEPGRRVIRAASGNF